MGLEHGDLLKQQVLRIATLSHRTPYSPNAEKPNPIIINPKPSG